MWNDYEPSESKTIFKKPTVDRGLLLAVTLIIASISFRTYLIWDDERSTAMLIWNAIHQSTSTFGAAVLIIAVGLVVWQVIGYLIGFLRGR